MRSNENLVLISQDGTLNMVPYHKHHVQRYHEWMKDPLLLELTASEPLTLKEEFEMQQSWHQDPEKCTFILMANNLEYFLADEKKLHFPVIDDVDTVSVEHFGAMIGDVNLYVNSNEESRGELEVMIAEPAARRKGFAYQAILMMIAYTHEEMNIRFFEVRISRDNNPSLSLFKDKLGFVEVDFSEFFNEVRLELDLSDPHKLHPILKKLDVCISKRSKYQPDK